MQVKLLNMFGIEVGSIDLTEEIFNRKYNEPLVHQIVTAFLANAQSGTRKQKTRSEVCKSTKKPWKQKGTGRARAGTASSPLWRGGGRAFPNTPDENFNQKINRKTYRAGIASILSKLIIDMRLLVIDQLNISTPKTKDFVNILKNMSLYTKTVLIIVDKYTDNLYYASRNLSNVLILESHQIDPHSLLRYHKIIFTNEAIKQLQEKWAC